MPGPHRCQVPPSLGDRALRVLHELAEHRRVQPPRSGSHFGERLAEQGLDSLSRDPAMAADLDVLQLAGVTQVDDMLARDTEHLRDLTGSQHR